MQDGLLTGKFIGKMPAKMSPGTLWSKDGRLWVKLMPWRNLRHGTGGLLLIANQKICGAMNAATSVSPARSATVSHIMSRIIRTAAPMAIHICRDERLLFLVMISIGLGLV